MSAVTGMLMWAIGIVTGWALREFIHKMNQEISRAKAQHLEGSKKV